MKDQSPQRIADSNYVIRRTFGSEAQDTPYYCFFNTHWLHLGRLCGVCRRAAASKEANELHSFFKNDLTIENRKIKADLCNRMGARLCAFVFPNWTLKREVISRNVLCVAIGYHQQRSPSAELLSLHISLMRDPFHNYLWAPFLQPLSQLTAAAGFNP